MVEDAFAEVDVLASSDLAEAMARHDVNVHGSEDALLEAAAESVRSQEALELLCRDAHTRPYLTDPLLANRHRSISPVLVSVHHTRCLVRLAHHSFQET